MFQVFSGSLLAYKDKYVWRPEANAVPKDDQS